VAPKKPAVIDQKIFEQVFVETEQVLKKNLVKLIKVRLDKETNFDARMAYKIAIKIIETGTLDDILSIDDGASDGEIVNDNTQKPQGEGSDI
jgi:hypothetical protein